MEFIDHTSYIQLISTTSEDTLFWCWKGVLSSMLFFFAVLLPVNFRMGRSFFRSDHIFKTSFTINVKRSQMVPLIQEVQMSVTGESTCMCTKSWLTTYHKYGCLTEGYHKHSRLTEGYHKHSRLTEGYHKHSRCLVILKILKQQHAILVHKKRINQKSVQHYCK